MEIISKKTMVTNHLQIKILKNNKIKAHKDNYKNHNKFSKTNSSLNLK